MYSGYWYYIVQALHCVYSNCSTVCMKGEMFDSNYVKKILMCLACPPLSVLRYGWLWWSWRQDMFSNLIPLITTQELAPSTMEPPKLELVSDTNTKQHFYVNFMIRTFTFT